MPEDADIPTAYFLGLARRNVAAAPASFSAAVPARRSPGSNEIIIATAVAMAPTTKSNTITLVHPPLLSDLAHSACKVGISESEPKSLPFGEALLHARGGSPCHSVKLWFPH